MERNHSKEKELTVADIAQSLHRLMATLVGMPEKWEELGYEKQAPWLAIAARGPARLEKLEGLPFREVAMQMFTLICPPGEEDTGEQAYFNLMDEPFRLRWEVLARHLNLLMNCDELVSLEDAERMWVEWYTRKLNSTVMNGR